MTSLINPDDYTTLWAVMVTGTVAAIWLEQTYKWAAKLSGPVVALLMAMALSNTGVMPADSPAYDFVGTWMVPLAIPLLLFRADVRRIFRAAGRVFVCFHLSAVGTLLGVAAAVFALRGRVGSPELEHAAGIMAGSYTGGSVNFFAVAQSYDVAAAVTNPLIVADNFVMAGVFVVLLSVGASAFFRRHFSHPHSLEADTTAAENLAAKHWQRKGIALLDIAKALAFGFVAMAIASLLGRAIQAAFGDVSDAGLGAQMLQTLCTNKFVLITGTSLVLATLFHKRLAAVNGPEEIGSYFLFLFLFVIGLPADLKAVLLNAPLFFLFCAIIAGINLAFTLAVGKLLRLPLEELLLAVNASLGGAPSAAAMAISRGWPRLVLPSILIGIWGYVIGTPIGIMVVEILKP
jgi:uncharacterized membrane protein